MDNKVDELDKLTERYEKTVTGLYLNKKINYSPPDTDYILIVGNHSIGGHYEGSLRKALVSDVDETITQGEILAVKWVRGLSEIKELATSVVDELIECLTTIPSLDKSATQKNLEVFRKRLVESRLHYKEYKEASVYAVDKLELVPFSEDFIHGLEEMGYVVSLNSGSPEVCVEELGARLGITRKYVGMDGTYPRIFGTRCKFDDKGWFTGEMEVCLGSSKEIKMDNFLENIRCPPKYSIFLSDDPESDKAPASKAGCAIWVDLGKRDSFSEEAKRFFKDLGMGIGMYKLPGKFAIYRPEARGNMNILLNDIKKLNLAMMIAYIRLPEKEGELYNLAQRFNMVKENALKAKEDFYKYKNEFLELAPNFKEFLKFLFKDENAKMKTISTLLRELRSSEDVEMDKNLMIDIFNRFGDMIPEIHAPKIFKSFGKELISIVEEKRLFDESEW